MKSIICIGGGVGPMAGVDLQKKIINNTNVKSDKEHVSVLHFSHSYYIEDRTEFLMDNTLINPAIGMFRTIQVMYESIKFETNNYQDIKTFVGIPCNTFHAPQIFNVFIDLLKQNNINVRVVNMIDETIQFIKTMHSGIKNVGLLSTTGTRDFNIYDNKLRKHSLKIIKLPNELQEKLHSSIYNKNYGIKAKSNPVSLQAISDIKLCADNLIDNGAEIIILGCTELPLALDKERYRNRFLVDTVDVLAKALVKKANDN